MGPLLIGFLTLGLPSPTLSGPPGKAVVEASPTPQPRSLEQWLKRLKDPDEWCRAEAARALPRLGAPASQVIPALITALREEKTLGRRFPVMGFYAGPDVQKALAEALTACGPAAVPALMETLRAPRADARWYAASALRGLGPRAKRAVPALIAALRDRDHDVRRIAALALGDIGPEGGPIVPALTAALRDRDWSVRERVAAALEHLGPAARGAVPALIRLIKHDSSPAGMTAKQAVAAVGAPAVPALIELLKEQDHRATAAELLGDIGPRAKAALPALLLLLRDESGPAYLDAVVAVWQIERAHEANRQAVSRLVRVLKGADEATTSKAAWGLSLMGPEAKAAVPALVDVLRNPRSGARYWAAEALGNIGPAAREAAVPALLQALRDGKPDVQYTAGETLRKLAPEVANKAGVP